MVTEESFKTYQGFDLTAWDSEAGLESAPRIYRVLRSSTLAEFIDTLAETEQVPPENLRLWVMVNRQNKTTRPDQPIPELDMTVDEAYTKYGSRDKTFRLWVEKASQYEDGKPIWPDTSVQNGNNQPLLIFLKYFDAESQSLKGVGHVYMKKHSKVAEIAPMIQQLMGWSNGSSVLTNGHTNGNTSPPQYALYEEIKHSMIEPMKPKSTLAQSEIQDGDIVCFQKTLTEKEALAISQAGGYTDAREYYDYLLNRKTVTFTQKGHSENNDSTEIKMDLSRKMSYEQFSAKVGEYLKVDPTHLRFWTVNATTGKARAAIKRNANQNLYQILTPSFGSYANSNQRDDHLYYEILDMSLSEFDTKKNLRVTWVTEGVSKEVLLWTAIENIS